MSTSDEFTGKLHALWQQARQQRHVPHIVQKLQHALQKKGDPQALTLQQHLNEEFNPHLLPKQSSPLKPCQILLITNLYPPQTLGGYGLLMADFARILKKKGHTLQILTTNTDYLGQAPSQEKNTSRTLKVFGRWEDGVTVPFPEHEAQTIAQENFHVVKQCIAQFQPDVCLIGDVEGLSCLVFDPLLDHAIPVVHHLGHSQPGYIVANTPTSPLYRLATASHWLKTRIQQQGYPLNPIEVIYSAGDVQHFYHPLLPTFDTLNIVFAGLMQPYKGPQTLLKALFFIKQQGVAFHCTFAGDSTDPAFLESCKQGIQEAGLQKYVTLVGKLNRKQLRDLYYRNNVLVFPSLVDEAFGMSQVEAMAAGMVVIGTGTGGADEVIDHDITGLKFPKQDANALAHHLIRLSQDPALCERLAKAGQKTALTCFNVEHSTQQIENIFDHMLNKKHRTH